MLSKQVFNKIIKTSKYYEEAQEKLQIINDKLALEEKIKQEKLASEEKNRTQVIGVKTAAYPTLQAPTTQPTSNPNKDSICRNEAELYKIQEKNKALDTLKSQRPELFWGKGEWLAHGYSEADLQYLIPQYKTYYNTAMSILDNAAQQTYLTKYNECLTK